MFALQQFNQALEEPHGVAVNVANISPNEDIDEGYYSDTF